MKNNVLNRGLFLATLPLVDLPTEFSVSFALQLARGCEANLASKQAPEFGRIPQRVDRDAGLIERYNRNIGYLIGG